MLTRKYISCQMQSKQFQFKTTTTYNPKMNNNCDTTKVESTQKLSSQKWYNKLMKLVCTEPKSKRVSEIQISEIAASCAVWFIVLYNKLMKLSCNWLEEISGMLQMWGNTEPCIPRWRSLQGHKLRKMSFKELFEGMVLLNINITNITVF